MQVRSRPGYYICVKSAVISLTFSEVRMIIGWIGWMHCTSAAQTQTALLSKLLQ